MGERLPIPLNVRGDLDTANPITDREAGTMIVAKDLNPRYWGPRAGSKAFARVWENPGTASLYDEITLTGVNTPAAGYSIEEQFRDLGTTFTLDLYFRLTDTTFAAGKTGIGLYAFNVGGAGLIDVSIYGPAHADHEKILVTLTTTSARGTAAAPVAFAGGTRLVAGSSQQHKYHVRLVRSGAAASLYLNGTLDGSTSSLSATNPMQGAVYSTGSAVLGYSSVIADTTVTFKGQMFAAVLRDGAFSSAPIEASIPINPLGRNVHHFHLGRDYSMGGSNHFFDASRNGVHARIAGAGFSVSAANDNAFPAPSSIQGVKSWTTRSGRTATAVIAGGVLSTQIIS